MNLPVQGEPVKFSQYFSAGKRNHLLGVAGGAIWAIGTAASMTVLIVSKAASAGPALTFGLGNAALLVSALWGLFVWKEFDGATGRAKALTPVMLVLFIVGLAMVSLAPSY